MSRLFAILACLLIQPASASADVRELSQAELRRAVAGDKAISTRRLVSGVEDFTGGDVVEIRAYDVDGSVGYRILVRQGSGQLNAIMVDGTTGHAISQSSRVGQQIVAVSRQNGSSTSAAATVRENGSQVRSGNGGSSNRNERANNRGQSGNSNRGQGNNRNNSSNGKGNGGKKK